MFLKHESLFNSEVNIAIFGKYHEKMMKNEVSINLKDMLPLAYP